MFLPATQEPLWAYLSSSAPTFTVNWLTNGIFELVTDAWLVCRTSPGNLTFLKVPLEWLIRSKTPRRQGRRVTVHRPSSNGIIPEGWLCHDAWRKPTRRDGYQVSSPFCCQKEDIARLRDRTTVKLFELRISIESDSFQQRKSRRWRRSHRAQGRNSVFNRFLSFFCCRHLRFSCCWLSSSFLDFSSFSGGLEYSSLKLANSAIYTTDFWCVCSFIFVLSLVLSFSEILLVCHPFTSTIHCTSSTLPSPSYFFLHLIHNSRIIRFRFPISSVFVDLTLIFLAVSTFVGEFTVRGLISWVSLSLFEFQIKLLAWTMWRNDQIKCNRMHLTSMR